VEANSFVNLSVEEFFEDTSYVNSKVDGLSHHQMCLDQ
jgi:hypothetical protein